MRTQPPPQDVNHKAARYPGFDYAAHELSAYSLSLNNFVLSLKNGKIINFVPEDTEAFDAWLVQHNIRDIRKK